MSDSRCVMLVLYESSLELVEAARAIIGDSVLIEIREGGWEELRTATDLDAVLVANIHAHERYGLAPRWLEAAIANVEWAREIIEPDDIPVRARWLVSPPMLSPSQRAEAPDIQSTLWWSIVLRDLIEFHTETGPMPLTRLGTYLRYALRMPLTNIAISTEQLQERLRLLHGRIEKFCNHTQRDDLTHAPH